jgi:uncharacterized membrane protein HdeD (DUF308 family)
MVCFGLLLSLPSPGGFLLSDILVIADGVLAFVISRRAGRIPLLWTQGIISGLAGSVALLSDLAWMSDRSIAASVVALWAICLGITYMMAAIRLRSEFKIVWLMAIGGVLLVIFGTFIMTLLGQVVDMKLDVETNPLISPWLLGIWPLASGISLITFAQQVRDQESRLGSR